jgi:hypothetical protein
MTHSMTDTAITSRDQSIRTFVARVRPGQRYVRLTVNVRRMAEEQAIWRENEAIRRAGR